ncbi:hypothetical protein Svir_06620 [Saccharomonospora viridis DSM 43017]|uniref:Transmembrane protein n=2 Tax=Saccharomonospora viridis TaxID=1852 RepID=C7MVL4_SACVD|nr:hypothetical protein Svir_06620 [Saccharomonospora viridis DSM 43017]
MDMAEPDTVELTVASSPEPMRARVPVWRGITGSVVAGWVAVLLVLLGAQVLAWVNGGEGPGVYPVVGHLVGVVLAGAAQYWAERNSGASAGVAGMVVVGVSATMLWLFWWS